MVPNASSEAAADVAPDFVPDAAPDIVPDCEDDSVGCCWAGLEPAAQIVPGTSVQTNRSLTTTRAAPLSHRIRSRNSGSLAMKPFGFDEAQDGTRCSQDLKFDDGTYNTGLKAWER
jgi:hypothetical protein